MSAVIPRLYHSPDLEPQTLDFYRPYCELMPQHAPHALNEGFALWLDAEGLALLAARHNKPFRLSDAELVARRRASTELTRACAVGVGYSVADPFAGFGMDALTLAGLGASVTASERHPMVYLLMRDFVERAEATVRPILQDGMAMLAEARAFDVVYLDPMFDHRRKRALPNRGLQHLRELAGDEEVDISALLDLARSSAKRRVVLKRRPKDATHDKPSHVISGKAVRFDVYT